MPRPRSISNARSGAPNGPNGTPGQGGQVRMPSGPQMPGPPVTAQQGQQRRMTSNPVSYFPVLVAIYIS